MCARPGGDDMLSGIQDIGYKIAPFTLNLTKVDKVRRASVNVERRPRTAASTYAPTYIHPDDVH